jgi:hypothetical protein
VTGTCARVEEKVAILFLLAAGAKDLVYWDAMAGFGLKVMPRGRKVFFVLYRTRDGAARLRKYTIGPYGIVTPAHGAVGSPADPCRTAGGA